MSAPVPAGHSLLVVIDPAARRADGESVRIAKDVLCAGAQAKICLPDGPEEVERALARRGSRRPVLVGDDRALLSIVELLHRERDLADASLSMVPVGGTAGRVALARSLGVPTGAVAAARAALDGAERRLDLLIDESGGVVLGGLRIPCGARGGYGAAIGPYDCAGPHGLHGPHGPYGPHGEGEATYKGEGGGGRGLDLPGTLGAGGHEGHWWAPAARTARTALTLLSGLRSVRPPEQRLRVEADGVLLADLDRPVEGVMVSTASRALPPGPAGAGPGERGGLADVVVHTRPGDSSVRARARAVTVSGPDFHYRADARVGGPVRSRTWKVLAESWSLMLPR